MCLAYLFFLVGDFNFISLAEGCFDISACATIAGDGWREGAFERGVPGSVVEVEQQDPTRRQTQDGLVKAVAKLGKVSV